MAASAGVGCMKIRDLDSNAVNFFVIGVIIAKQDPNAIAKRGYDGSSERGVWNFMLRDSPWDCIIVTAWGDRDHIFSLSESFHVGDVVELANPRLRRPLDMNDMYNPVATSPYQLTIVESQTTLNFYHGDNSAEIAQLSACLTKPPSDIFTLADVHANGENMKGEFVNLLVAVSRVGPERKLKGKTGRDLICRDVTVFDQTNANLLIQLWNQENVKRAENWKPRETILFLADVKLVYSDYRHGMTASDGRRSVITENPSVPEAEGLREYARMAPIQSNDIIDHLASAIPDPRTIRNVLTVQQMLDRGSQTSDEPQFTGLLYCVVTKLDLDGVFPQVVTRCTDCRTVMEDGNCTNANCGVGGGYLAPMTTSAYDIRVSLSDHTGSVHRCRLTGAAAENILGCSAAEFLNLTMDEKTFLKWRFLLERCAVRVLVLRTSFERLRPLVSILACEIADPVQVAARIPIY